MGDIAVVTLYTESCCVCGITYGFPESYEKKRRVDHKTWTCPNGHTLSFCGESEQERLSRELKVSERLRESCRKSRESAERSNSALRGHLTRKRNQAGDTHD